MLYYDLVVIGGGPAALAAGMEADKQGVEKILILERESELGGILQQCIHSGFGLHIFNEELTGPEYAQRFIDTLQETDVEYKLDTTVVELTKDKHIKALNPIDGILEIQAKAVILAMGCREKTRDGVGIPGKRPAGIFTAGAAQRYMNIEGYQVGSRAIIVGSGDIGLIMARRLTLEGVEVVGVVEILPFSCGLQRNIVQCLKDFDIPLLLSHTVTDIVGQDRVEGVMLSLVDENRDPIPGTEIFYACDTVLLSVGLAPENELSKNAGIQLDKKTLGPIVNERMETNIEGIFACGNVVHVHDLVDYVTLEARKAGRYAALHIQTFSTTEDQRLLTKTSTAPEIPCLHAKTSTAPETSCLHVTPGTGIRYIVPQEIHLKKAMDSLELFLRPDNLYKDVTLVIKSGEDILKKIPKKNMSPGKMEKISLSLEVLELLKQYSTSEITIELAKEVS